MKPLAILLSFFLSLTNTNEGNSQVLTLDNIPALMLESFLRMTKEDQEETVMLGANARFVLMMTEDMKNDSNLEVLRIIREALVRGIPSLQGK